MEEDSNDLKKICNKFSFIDQPNYYKKHEKQGYIQSIQRIKVIFNKQKKQGCSKSWWRIFKTKVKQGCLKSW